ncbi:alkaline phosphatase D family protein [Bailinhaonella thermotolerans]|uniref:alkaline phosphatase D family protein n=1 Tax=Bailinhaonella thermotolerans TaxID=1070861 RepID=UPI001F5C0877|nr:alkaline phosphatase D family protein [Bailinhaonella thermotolerans]
MGREVTRRSFLVAGIGAAALGAAPRAGAGARPADPFTLGVASGDPGHRGFVLWTRLAPRPLNDDGLGGMPRRDVTVEWVLARDERFRRVERRGTVVARAASAHSVHVELGGLDPGREYWYRFRAQGHVSPAGRTRTAPSPGAYGGPLRMAFASCSQYEHGYFTAYRRLAEDDPDLVLHLGDYLYEYAPNVYVAGDMNVRHHAGPETVTLANYRQRHAQYKTDPDLRAAHAAAPWLVVWDDHELDNNWAGYVPEIPDPPAPQPDMRARRAAAFRAYYENMPLRRSAIPRGPAMRLHRRVRWGRLAAFHMLDTRQYRHDQACGDGFKECPEAYLPGRTILGPEQERWLAEGFRRSEARWDLLGQQAFFGQRDADESVRKVTNMDAWDGYAACRDRVARSWMRGGVRNAVVLTGDVHAHWAGELKLDYDDPSAPSIGTELVTTSITSGGDGADSDPAEQPMLWINPHLRFHNNQRGYVLTRITKEAISAEFRVVPAVTRPGAPAHTKARFVIADRDPRLHLEYLRPYTGPALRSDAAVIRDTIARETDRP